MEPWKQLDLATMNALAALRDFGVAYQRARLKALRSPSATSSPEKTASGSAGPRKPRKGAGPSP